MLAGSVGREPSGDGGMVSVALGLSGRNQAVECGRIWDTLIKDLARQDRELDFSHAVSHRRAAVSRGTNGVQPTAMFGREVKLQLARDAQCLSRCKGFIQRRQGMRMYPQFCVSTYQSGLLSTIPFRECPKSLCNCGAQRWASQKI